jgi:hypothetical protein
MNVMEKYILQIKENKTIVRDETAVNAAILIYNIVSKGFEESSSSECNKFKKYFDEGNKFDKLVDMFKFVNCLASTSKVQREIINWMAISICLLLSRVKPPRSCDVVLSYINILRLTPSTASEDKIDFPTLAQLVWNEIVDYVFYNSENVDFLFS